MQDPDLIYLRTKHEAIGELQVSQSCHKMPDKSVKPMINLYHFYLLNIFDISPVIATRSARQGIKYLNEELPKIGTFSDSAFRHTPL